MELVLVGDSDIARWPKELLPSVILEEDKPCPISVSGQSGATLGQVLPLVQKTLSVRSRNFTSTLAVFIVCAGENDIGMGISLNKTESDFQDLLSIIFPDSESESTGRLLIFLGPKFEPWMAHELEPCQQYARLSDRLERCCRQHLRANRIAFINCLTMFCGESGRQPGAVLGGRAVSKVAYFDSDELHLSPLGYRIWKDVVESQVLALLQRETRQNL